MSSPRLLLGLIALVSIGTLLVPVPANATPFGVEIRSHQFNLCDAACNKPNPPEDMVTFMMALEEPHTVSLNELCFATSSSISAARRVTIALYQSRTTPNCPISGFGTRGFGSGAVVAGSTSPPVATAGAYPTQQPASPNEVRGYACIRGTTYVGHLVSCSAHLKNGDAAIARRQANEYAFLVAATPSMAQPLRVLAGDFNLTPTQRPPIYFPESSSSFRRPIINLTIPADDPTTTYDYIHVLKPQLTSVSVASRVCDGGYSDHCYLYSRYT
jgi:hypothetical protein